MCRGDLVNNLTDPARAYGRIRLFFDDLATLVDTQSAYLPVGIHLKDNETSSSHPMVNQLVQTTPRAIGIWLLVCCALIFVMVVLGGVTRLTHSGLSMVQWRPVTGALPPLNHAAWQQAFEDYKQYPEYQKLNQDMDLAGFKSIFWYEYLHRLLGRVIGLVFLLPFLYFLIRKRIPPGLTPRLVAIFILGGFQGLLGWYMVKSGLVDRPDVSQYRLTAHLGAAFLIYAYSFWVALGLLFPIQETCSSRGALLLRTLSLILLGLIAIAALSGGLVAGLDAGFAYNTFPLMGGRLVPEGLLMMQPPVRNLFENLITVQFDHRVLAILVLVSTVALWLWSLRLELPARGKMALHCLVAAVTAQVMLGISTLVLVVPVPLAAAHQAGALVLLTASVWVVYELGRGAR